MKKIVFVQKQESGYDPVATFFNKTKNDPKNIPRSATSNKNIAKPSQATKAIKNQVKPIQQKRTEPKIPDLKGRTAKEDKSDKQQVKLQHKASLQLLARQSNVPPKNQEQSVPVSPQQQRENKAHAKRNNELADRNKELQKRQEELMRRLQEYEASQQQASKNQQRLTKLQKDYKAALQKLKEGESSKESLQLKQQQIKELLSGKSIPYCHKRQVLMSNKILELKRVNRILVQRLKNYKGSDLAQMATSLNRGQILNQVYEVDVETEHQNELKVKMESLVSELIQRLNAYLQSKLQQRSVKNYLWGDEQLQLSEIANLAEQISLQYLTEYDVCPCPKSNQYANSVHSLIQRYKQNSRLSQVSTRFNINHESTLENSQNIKEIEKLHQAYITNRRPKKAKAELLNKHIDVMEKYANLKDILTLQSIAQFQLMAKYLQEQQVKLNKSLSAIQKVIQQMKCISALGRSGIQSLFVFAEQNLPRLQRMLPQTAKIARQIKIDFQELEKHLIT